MMARAVYQFCIYRNINLFGWIQEDHMQSNVDEFLSYIFAAMGFYFQFVHSFSLPFPLNVVLLPFQLAEYWIRWTITKRAN